MQYPCPCCGYLTLEAQPPGSYEICAVCFWEDDPFQSVDPHAVGGANRVSLRQAQKNYAQFGACEEGMLAHIRAPLPEELPNLTR